MIIVSVLMTNPVTATSLMFRLKHIPNQCVSPIIVYSVVVSFTRADACGSTNAQRNGP